MNEQQIKLVMAGVKKDQELAACQADV